MGRQFVSVPVSSVPGIPTHFPRSRSPFTLRSELSLVALLRPQVMDQHAALIDFNVSTFREAVLAIFDVGLSQTQC